MALLLQIYSSDKLSDQQKGSYFSFNLEFDFIVQQFNQVALVKFIRKEERQCTNVGEEKIFGTGCREQVRCQLVEIEIDLNLKWVAGTICIVWPLCVCIVCTVCSDTTSVCTVCIVCALSALCGHCVCAVFVQCLCSVQYVGCSMHLTKLSPTSSSGFKYYMFYFHDKAIPINEICGL